MGKNKKKLTATAKRELVICAGLRFHRKFDGETYTFRYGNVTKPDANAYADNKRSEGKKARVVKTRVAKWCVYVR